MNHRRHFREAVSKNMNLNGGIPKPYEQTKEEPSVQSNHLWRSFRLSKMLQKVYPNNSDEVDCASQASIALPEDREEEHIQPKEDGKLTRLVQSLKHKQRNAGAEECQYTHTGSYHRSKWHACGNRLENTDAGRDSHMKPRTRRTSAVRYSMQTVPHCLSQLW